MYLAENYYVDEIGQSINASQIPNDVLLGTYKGKCDGFFEWQCPHCKEIITGREFRTNGCIHICPKCGKKALLIRTDCGYVSSVMQAHERHYEKLRVKLDRAIAQLGKAVQILAE